MQIFTSDNGVKYLRSDKIKCPNGFSTRIGGVSREPHTRELNLQFRRGDSDETVFTNLKKFAEAVGVLPESFTCAHQIHSNKVISITKSDSGKGYFKADGFECDGFVTSDVGVTLAVKTADCVPILMSGEDGQGNVIAVAAVHAGWRGTAKNIVSVGVLELKERGIDPKNIYAAIGPHICAECFEVDPDCRDEMISMLGAPYESFISQKGKKFHIDLGGINRHQLMELGVPEENTDLSDSCTACLPELFYSHRKMNGQRGTMLSVISIV